MNLYKYWARAKGKSDGANGEDFFTCFGYSNDSLEEALALAQQRAGDAERRRAAGSGRDEGKYYANAPIREEIVDEFADGNETTAVITRNSYGCLILNTPGVFFADVDLPPRSFAQALKGMFTNKTPEGTALAERLQALVAADRSLRIRLYRTMMGFRVMIISRQIDATAAESKALFERLGADKLYVSLCQSQDCYRARLTPKPWRCGYKRPPTVFPFASAHAEKRHRDWETKYNSVAKDYATCELIAEFGEAKPDAVAAQIYQLHDHFALNGNKPLA